MVRTSHVTVHTRSAILSTYLLESLESFDNHSGFLVIASIASLLNILKDQR